jgi:hypothetical protein
MYLAYIFPVIHDIAVNEDFSIIRLQFLNSEIFRFLYQNIQLQYWKLYGVFISKITERDEKIFFMILSSLGS